MTIRAVLFDLGDTLWHFPDMPTIDAIAAESGRRIDAHLAREGMGMPGIGLRLARAVMEADRAATLAGMHGDGRSPDFAALVRRCAAVLQLDLDEARAGAVWDDLHVGGPFLRRALFPDSIPLLEELRRRGFLVGGVTNRSLGGRRFQEELEAMLLAPLFDTMAVSADHGWLKPHRALFDAALDDLGLRPEEALMVGDDLFADVFGAKAIGMPVVWKRPPGRNEAPTKTPDGKEVLPDHTIDHPAQLLEGDRILPRK